MALPLSKRYLSDSDAERLYSVHKGLGKDYLSYCPTCLKEGFYYWPDKETRVECDCRAQLNLHKQYLNAGVGALYQRLTWADYKGEPELDDAIYMYLDKAKQMVARGIGIVLSGPVGTGKTLAITLILKELLHQGFTVFSTTFANLIELMTAGWSSPVEKEFFIERVRKSQVLLVDDIGKEHRTKTGLGSSAFDAVLRSRVQDGLPTFITTNLSMEEMDDGYGSAILSLLRETSIVHQVNGTDHREAAGQQKLKEIMSGLTRPIV